MVFLPGLPRSCKVSGDLKYPPLLVGISSKWFSNLFLECRAYNMPLPMFDTLTFHHFHSHPSMDLESDVNETESERYSMASTSMASRSVSSAPSSEIDHSMRSPSPLSVMSINSDMKFFKNEFGRQLNNYSDIYRLPADTEELNRLGILESFILYHLMIL